MYTEKELQELLNTKTFGRKLYIYDNIESTNILAKRVASLGADEGTVVITEFQTAGRGRMGKIWIGDPTSNLLLSLIIRPKIDNTKIGLLPFFTGVGVAFTIEALTGLSCECKWPNDLLLNGRKCCGILLENSFQGSTLEYAVIGIGLNVNQEHFGEELDRKATSLFNECGKRIEVKDVFKHLLLSLESLYRDVQKGYFNTTLREWKSRTKMFGKEVTVIENDSEVTGTAIDIANDGGLIRKLRRVVEYFMPVMLRSRNGEIKDALMFIAIDIGNTHTVIGIYKQEIIINILRISSKLKLNNQKIIQTLKSFVADSGFKLNQVNGIGISSVIPELTKKYYSAINRLFHRKPLIITSEFNLGFKIFYDDPTKLGADRICATVAGYAKYGGPLIVIDFGTATTYDAVSSTGDFLGGVIAPGIKTLASVLHKRTAKLPEVDLILPTSIIAMDTTTGIQTGILWGTIDATTGLVKRIQKELRRIESKEAMVIATGGFSEFVAKNSKVIQYVEPNLVLDGIRIIYERVENKKQKK